MDENIRTLLQGVVSLAALGLDTRYAVLRLADGSIIASGEDVPVDEEAPLAERATRHDAPVFVSALDRKDDAGISFHVAAVLRGASGEINGTLAAFDSGARSDTWDDRQILEQLAAQAARLLEVQNVLAAVESQCRRLDAFVNAVAVPAYVVEHGRFVWVNSKFANALGYTREELLALDSPVDLVLPEEQEFVREILRRREAGDTADVRYSTRVRARDGSVLHAESHGSVALVDGHSYIVGVGVDISEQSRERRRVLDRQEYFRALTENASDVIAILNVAGAITYITPSVERVLGYAPGELQGLQYVSLVHPDDRERVQAVLDRLAQISDASVPVAAYQLRSISGSWRVLESVGSNLLGHPQVRGLVLNMRDITDRKVLEAEVEQLHRLTSLGRLSAQVAHEFNNVMMGIAPFVEIVRRRAGDDANLHRSADAMTSAIARGKRITTDILRFGRPAQPALRSVDVREVIRHAVREIGPLLPHDVALQNGPTDVPLYIAGDPSQLSQVLINLALNARDAIAGPGTITIAARLGTPGEFPRGGDYVHITLTDTGAGIDNVDLPYIFEPLFTTKKTGTGLGLSVVWQIVTAHHGHISVDTEKGKGTTLHIYLPAIERREIEQVPDGRPPSEAMEKHRVLVIEDEPTVAEGLRMILEAEGFEVAVAENGETVTERLAEQVPDVVILDLSLPDEDGRDTYRRVFASSGMPTIFSSGHAGEGDIESLLLNEHTAFLMKPYTSDELLSTIAQLLGKGWAGN
jgi:PAS domain S-box-containing protein